MVVNLAQLLGTKGDPDEVQANRSDIYPAQQEFLAHQHHVFPVFGQDQGQDEAQGFAPAKHLNDDADDSDESKQDDPDHDHPLHIDICNLMRMLLPYSPQILQILILLLQVVALFRYSWLIILLLFQPLLHCLDLHRYLLTLDSNSMLN